MNLDYNGDEFAHLIDTPEPTFEMGSRPAFVADDAPRTSSRSTSPNAVYNAFLALVREHPEFGWRAGKELGLQAFTTPKERPDPMPSKGVVAIEVAFGDRGPSKAKRKREDRIAARFDATIQVSVVGDQGVSKPSFKGRVDFYSPERARIKANELSKPTKTRTPFSPAYLAMIGEAIADVAEPNDLLIGFLHTKPPKSINGGGTYYHNCQLVLARRTGLEAHSLDTAFIMHRDDKGSTLFSLPRTDKLTSKGKPLAGTYKMQSRGVVKAGHFENEWETGAFRMQRQSAT